MGKLVIQGQNRLEGKLSVHGSKNSVLPILAATMIGRGQSVIENCPDLSDTAAACDILRQLGCSVWLENGAAIVENGGYGSNKIPEKLMREMRSSVIFLGAILSRDGSAVISFPGGCELGPRPIDLHMSALSQMGGQIQGRGRIPLLHLPARPAGGGRHALHSQRRRYRECNARRSVRQRAIR